MSAKERRASLQLDVIAWMLAGADHETGIDQAARQAVDAIEDDRELVELLHSALQVGSDILALSDVFELAGHPMTPRVGMAALREILLVELEQ